MFMLSILLQACSSTKNDEPDEVQGFHAEAELGDIREETNGVSSKPSFLHDKPEEPQLPYLEVAKNQAVLENSSIVWTTMEGNVMFAWK